MDQATKDKLLIRLGEIVLNVNAKTKWMTQTRNDIENLSLERISILRELEDA